VHSRPDFHVRFVFKFNKFLEMAEWSRHHLDILWLVPELVSIQHWLCKSIQINNNLQFTVVLKPSTKFHWDHLTVFPLPWAFESGLALSDTHARLHYSPALSPGTLTVKFTFSRLSLRLSGAGLMVLRLSSALSLSLL